jgi:enoyl-CoA hydratase/carnithine racemase
MTSDIKIDYPTNPEIAHITMCRGPVNSLDLRTIKALTSAIKAVENNPKAQAFM